MSAAIERPDDNLWILRVRGVLRKSELNSIQSRYARDIEPGGQAKLLVLLEAFEGWEQGAAWDDLDFFATHGDSITKIAFVGDPRWEFDAMTFAGAGIRDAPVRFFPPMAEAEARAWLD
jgi:hypothetical protein